jgi:cellulose binding protein with CBM1 domain/EXPB1-like protein
MNVIRRYSRIRVLTSSTGGGINWTGGTSCASGLACVVQNPYYSQCLPRSEVIASSASPSPSTIVPPIQPVPSSASVAPTPSKPSSVGSGVVYKSSFTHYGAGDSFGSPNCNTNTAACGFFTQPGFSAAVSQNL